MTIIAKIDGTELLLQNLSEAEQLLRILSGAKVVDRRYFVDHGYVRHYARHGGCCEISVTIEPQEIVSFEEFQRLEKQEEEKAAARRAATTATSEE